MTAEIVVAEGNPLGLVRRDSADFGGFRVSCWKILKSTPDDVAHGAI